MKLTQVQKQTQGQTLLPQQLLVSTLTNMPLEELRERIDQELKENISLEENRNESWEDDEGNISATEPLPEENIDSEESESEFASPLTSSETTSTSTSREWVASSSQTFLDTLQEQIGFYETTTEQREILEYLIGSLDDDGILRTPLQQICDELEVYHNIIAPISEIKDVLTILQTFDPPGVGAQSLQECLLLQVERQDSYTLSESLKEKLLHLLNNHFGLLMLKRWDKIQQAMQLSDIATEELQQAIRKLNPRPGSSFGDIMGKNNEQITPDFIVEIDEDGRISFSINNANLPVLTVNNEDTQQLQDYDAAQEKLTKSEREGYTYLKEQVTKAKNFINALQQRHDSMQRTMKTIIEIQHEFFETGDEMQLHPMNLATVAEKSGLHLSTVSRVSNAKWVQTPFGIYPLKYFFTSAAHLDGEEVSVRNIKAYLQNLIDNEDKKQPLNDDEIVEALHKAGYTIARRTVAKYRNKMNIPVARLRKE